MVEDQEYILSEIINIVDEELAVVMLICDDVYDKSLLSAEAVALFNNF